MPTVALFNQDGTQNGDVQLNEAVFGIEPNESVDHATCITSSRYTRS